MTSVTVEGDLRGKRVSVTLKDDGTLAGDRYLIELVRAKIRDGATLSIEPLYPTVSPSLEDPWTFAITAASCLTGPATFNGDLPEITPLPESVDS